MKALRLVVYGCLAWDSLGAETGPYGKNRSKTPSRSPAATRLLRSGYDTGVSPLSKEPTLAPCAPEGPTPVFVVATGRSGSTSLMDLLRELPGGDFTVRRATMQTDCCCSAAAAGGRTEPAARAPAVGEKEPRAPMLVTAPLQGAWAAPNAAGALTAQAP